MANSPIPEAGGGIARRGGWLIVLSAPPGFDRDRLGEATAEMAGYARRPGICAVAGLAHRLSGAQAWFVRRQAQN